MAAHSARRLSMGLWLMAGLCNIESCEKLGSPSSGDMGPIKC
jgi:hypothetical protein